MAKVFGADSREDARSNSDIRDSRVAAMGAAGQQQMAGLAAKECDGMRGVDRGATDLSAGAVDAGGNIDSEDWPFWFAASMH